ncbi:MAG: ATPase, T2SS/T4P/T4SS family [Polyangiales bacterium]
MSHLDDYVRKLDVVQGTDLLLSSGRPPLYRALDGLLPLPGEGALAESDLRSELVRVLSPDERQQLADEQRVTFQAELDSGRRVHGAAHESAHGLTVKLRLLGAQADELLELELPKVLEPLFEVEAGLIVVTGPSGSGKSTFVARLLSEIAAERSVYIATCEDPVEYPRRSGSSVLVQRAVGPHCPTHARAIETAIATDAQVIACSDASEPSAFGLLLEAACSGVLAVAELPGHGVVRALEQLYAAVPESARAQWSADLADALHAVVALELLPTKLSSRVWAAEVLLSTRNVCSFIRDGKLSLLAGLLDREPGMQSMDRCLLDLATRGVVEGREAFVRASDKRLLAAWG